MSTAGNTPAPPAVGAATITPIAAFTSCTASARASTSRNGVPPTGALGRAVTSFAASPPTSPDADLKVAGQSLLDRALHDVQRAPQHVANLLDRPALIVGLGLERQLRRA